jgi:hypothetical protein
LLAIEPEAEEVEPVAGGLGLEPGDNLDELRVMQRVPDFEDVLAGMPLGEVGAVAVPLLCGSLDLMGLQATGDNPSISTAAYAL